MAGRGGGGRPTTSLTQEQLSALGINSKEMQNVITAPPPIFPTLKSRPVPLEKSSARNYKILWKEDFMSYLKDSPYFTRTSDSDAKIKRYSDRYVQVLTNKDKVQGDFVWKMFPAELRPNFKRKMKMDQRTSSGKQIRVVNIEEKLKALEQMEKTGQTDDTANKKKDSDDEDNVEDEQMDEDDEMDEENDYGNSYFDNGDAYNDEDDNLDDGPVY